MKSILTTFDKILPYFYTFSDEALWTAAFNSIGKPVVFKNQEVGKVTGVDFEGGEIYIHTEMDEGFEEGFGLAPIGSIKIYKNNTILAFEIEGLAAFKLEDN